MSFKQLVEDSKSNGALLQAIARKVYEKIQVGTEVMQLAIDTEEMIRKCNKHVASPMSIEINNIVNNFAPMLPYNLTKDDIISYSLTLANDRSGFGIVKCAYSVSLSGLHDDIIEGITDACLAGIKECGPDARFIDVSKAIYETLRSLDIHTLTNVCGHSLNNAKRVIPCIPTPASKIYQNYEYQHAKMKVGETFCIEVYGTDYIEDQEAIVGLPTMYFINQCEKKPPPRLSSLKSLYQMAANRYQNDIFSLRDLQLRMRNSNPNSGIRKYFIDKNGELKQKIFDNAFRRLVREAYISPLYGCKLPANPQTGNMNIVSHIGHSVLITENGAIPLC
jgi:methionine aminopeptidase